MRQVRLLRLPWLAAACFLTLALPFAPTPVEALDNSFGAVDCECYNAEDCDAEEPGDWICRGFDLCNVNGKIHGTCLAAGISQAIPRGLLVDAVSLYFDAYLVAISSGEGRPDVDILNRARAVKLNEVQHGAAKEAVELALDAVIGFDFQFPRTPGQSAPGKGVNPSTAGNIRGTPIVAAAITEAARAGICEAISTRNLNAVAPALEAFWAAHPDFHPNHTGRLYPHGHDDYEETVGSPLEGQIDLLKRILRHLLSDGSPLCGNNKLEGFEACDGTDDSACPQLCSTDCACGFVP